MLYAFAVEENRAISPVSATTYDVRTDDIVFNPVGSTPSAQTSHVTNLVIAGSSTTSDSRVHLCRKKRCPKDVMDYIDTNLAALQTDCASCDCAGMGALKTALTANAEFQSAIYDAGTAPFTAMGKQEPAGSKTHFLASGCNMYFFQKYPAAANFYASCELGAAAAGAGGTFTPATVAAKGSYWFTTDVLGCSWDTGLTGCTDAGASTGADNACMVATADWNTALTSRNPFELSGADALVYNSAVLGYSAKRNTRPNFYRGRADANNGDRAEFDDWQSSYAEFSVKTAAPGVVPTVGTSKAVDAYYVDVTLTSATPGSKIHYCPDPPGAVKRP